MTSVERRTTVMCCPVVSARATATPPSAAIAGMIGKIYRSCLAADSEASHREVGEYAAARVDELLVVGRGAAGVQAGGGGTLVEDNAAAVAWLREHLRAGDAVLVKASRGARLDEVAAALA